MTSLADPDVAAFAAELRKAGIRRDSQLASALAWYKGALPALALLPRPERAAFDRLGIEAWTRGWIGGYRDLRPSLVPKVTLEPKLGLRSRYLLTLSLVNTSTAPTDPTEYECHIVRGPEGRLVGFTAAGAEDSGTVWILTVPAPPGAETFTLVLPALAPGEAGEATAFVPMRMTGSTSCLPVARRVHREGVWSTPRPVALTEALLAEIAKMVSLGGRVRLACVSCGGTTELLGTERQGTCEHCKSQFWFAACVRCQSVNEILGAGSTWACQFCLTKNGAVGTLAPAVIRSALDRRGELERRGILDATEWALLGGFTVVGGSGLGLAVGSPVSLLALPDFLRVHVESEQGVTMDIPYAEIISLDLEGTSDTVGGGFIGGGFGAKAAVEGMAISTILNALTTKVVVDTRMRVATMRGEMLLQSQVPKEVVRRGLSLLWTRWESNQRAMATGSRALVDDQGDLMPIDGTGSTASAGFKTCPQCAEDVKAAARICRFCRYEFEPLPSGTEPPLT